jgi:hypothetical protein
LAMKLADEQRVFAGDETCRRVVHVDDARRYVVSRAAWRCYAYVYASTLAPLTFRCQPPAEGSLFFAELLTRQRDGVAATARCFPRSTPAARCMLALQQQGVESSRASRQQGFEQHGVRRWEEKMIRPGEQSE